MAKEKQKTREVSPAGSLKGWNAKTLLARNKDTLKGIVMFIAGYSYLVGFDWKVFIAGLVAIIGKGIVDTIDFCATEVKLE